jgi:hypothetical protein
MGSFIPPTSAQGLTNLEGLRQVVCIVPGVALVVLPWSRRFEQPPILLCIPKSAPSMSTPAVVMATGTATKHAQTLTRDNQQTLNQQTLTRAHKQPADTHSRQPADTHSRTQTTSRHSLSDNQQTLTRAHKHAFAQNHVCDSHTCASNRDTTRRASQTRDTSVRHGSMARHTAHGTDTDTITWTWTWTRTRTRTRTHRPRTRSPNPRFRVRTAHATRTELHLREIHYCSVAVALVGSLHSHLHKPKSWRQGQLCFIASLHLLHREGVP